MSGQLQIGVCQRCLAHDVELFYTRAFGWICEACVDDEPRRKPTRQERLEAQADRGVDTWSEYKQER